MTTITLATDEGIRRAGDDAVSLADTPVTALAAGDEGLWALSGRDLLRVGGGAPIRVDVGDDRARCVLAVDGDVYVGTDGAHLLHLDAGRLARVDAFEHAPTRPEWHTPWGGPASTRSMAARGGTLLVNVHVGGILRSDDAGASWRPTLDLHVDVHQVAVAPDGTLWAATGAAGLGESPDLGETWRYHDEGLHGTYLRSVAPSTDGVVVTASSGPHSGDGAVYRFDGERFTLCDDGIPTRFAGNLDTYSLAARGRTVALAGLDDRLYVSDDGGHRWEAAETDAPDVRAVLVT